MLAKVAAALCVSAVGITVANPSDVVKVGLATGDWGSRRKRPKKPEPEHKSSATRQGQRIKALHSQAMVPVPAFQSPAALAALQPTGSCRMPPPSRRRADSRRCFRRVGMLGCSQHHSGGSNTPMVVSRLGGKLRFDHPRRRLDSVHLGRQCGLLPRN